MLLLAIARSDKNTRPTPLPSLLHLRGEERGGPLTTAVAAASFSFRPFFGIWRLVLPAPAAPAANTAYTAYTAMAAKLKKFLLRYYPPGIILQYERDGVMKQKPIDLLDLTPDVDMEVGGTA